MQGRESEIVIPLKMPFNFKNALITLCVIAVLGIGGFIAWIIEGFNLIADASRFPAIQEQMHQDMISGTVAFVLALMLYALLFLFFFRQMHAVPPYIRVSHEGIFTSRDAFLWKWEEIKELSLATFVGSPFLRIVPWNLAEVARRAKASAGPFTRFGIHLTLMFFGRLKSPAPPGIFQMALPIPIHELLTAIQEQYGTELREHHILIDGTQY